MPYIKASFFLMLFSLISSCANVGALKGGAKDTTPPKVVAKGSTPNMQTNFKKQPILLTFDEWIKLDDVFTQVVVSPPLNERPEVVLDRKTVRFEFAKEEVLREKATYTINFGNAIKDLTEGNATDFRFVFSTGNTIDSLMVIGKVVDALTGQPTEGVLLMLYDNLSDTVVKKKRPFYFSKTNKEGIAKIENVRSGTFKVFALKDNDVNYLFNQDIEKIGFPLENLTLSADNAAPIKMDSATMRNDTLRRQADSVAASKSALVIRLFDPEKSLKIMNKDLDKYGVAKLMFNQPIKKANIRFDNINQNALTEISKDTLLVWYNQGDEAPWNIYNTNGDKMDTLRVRPRGRADFFKKNKLSLVGDIKTSLVNITKPLTINFNFPIQNIDKERFKLLDTAKKAVPFTLIQDSLSKRKLTIQAILQEGRQYDLIILPNALTDIYNFKNTDTLDAKINVQSKKEFGDVMIDITGLDSSKSYICQLITGGGDMVSEHFIDKSKSFKQLVEWLQPDQYTLKVIEDINSNRQWDTGDYDKKRQPERIFLKQLAPLRANWNVDTEGLVIFF
jgi:uncharacterized protein (DUF2141 family)